MRISFAVLTLCISLLGCASPRPSSEVIAFREYIAQHKPRAEQGLMKWSDYYQGVYSAMLAIKPMPPAFHLNQVNTLLARALDLEAGRITAEQFAQVRRDHQVAVAAQAEEEARRAQIIQAQESAAAGAIGMQLLQMGQPRPAQPSINCVTTQQGPFTNTNCR